MSKAPISQKLVFDGPAGSIEAILESSADGGIAGVVVVCHPHPQHGGTMHNKVAHTLARSFVGSGFAALRFNFRGTELSEGEYDDGNGEVDDVVAALAWLRERYPNEPTWLAGFSFGAAMAVKAATRVDLDGLVSVAPAIYRFAGELPSQPQCPWLIVQGDQDELVAVDETVAWVDALEPGPELVVMHGVEHFFHGRLIDLRECVRSFVEDNMRA